jgi:phage host-nuclease inhibitor protein Gam
VAQS